LSCIYPVHSILLLQSESTLQRYINRLSLVLCC
jgi:hypothetical protein